MGILIVPAILGVISILLNPSYYSVTGHPTIEIKSILVFIIYSIIYGLISLFSLLALLYAIKDSNEGIGVWESYKRGSKRIFSYIWIVILMVCIIFGYFIVVMIVPVSIWGLLAVLMVKVPRY